MYTVSDTTRGKIFYIRKEFLVGTVLYKTKSLDGTKPNTNPKTNHNANTNPIQLFYAFFRAPSHDLQTS